MENQELIEGWFLVNNYGWVIDNTDAGSFGYDREQAEEVRDMDDDPSKWRIVLMREVPEEKETNHANP